MTKVKFIIVQKKKENIYDIPQVVKRIDANHLFNDFQIGYECGKLTKEFPEDKYVIYMQKS